MFEFLNHVEGKMGVCKLAAIAILISFSSFAAGPSAREAKKCVLELDADLVAELGPKISNPCANYLRLDNASIVDVSKAENTADVMVRLRYTVIKGIASNALGRCINISDQGEDHPISVGTEIPTKDGKITIKDRKISMQEWTTGWKCKN
jgi:hypothetical protein